MSIEDPESLEEMLDDCRRVARDNLDRFIVVTGRERLGKSTLARRLGHALDSGFGVDRIHFSTRSLMEMAEKIPRGSVLVLDEPIDGAEGSKHFEEDARAFKDFMIVCGELNLVIIICTPRLDVLLKYARGHRIDYWFLIQSRGVYLLHAIVRRDYPGGKSFWRKICKGLFPDIPAEDPETVAYREKKALHRRDLQRRSSDRYEPTSDDVEAWARPLRRIFRESGLGLKES